jgi:hypothetical protein
VFVAALLLLLQEPASVTGGLIKDWEMEIERAREKAEGEDWGSALANELATRVAVEQAARRGIARLQDSGGANTDKAEAVAEAIGRVQRMDQENTEFLKRNLPDDGWFRISRDGETSVFMAWLIVQHSPDRAFQKIVLERMKPLFAAGEVTGRSYALLFDRLALYEGRPQRYGSQAKCEQGIWRLHSLEDEEKVDALRTEVGLAPLAEYEQQLGIGRPC